MLRSSTAAVAVCLLMAGCSASASGAAGRHHHRARSLAPVDSPVATSTRPAGSCHARGTTPSDILPDPNCTPGVTNPDVTQANIHQTICVRGYTKTIRPPLAYTAPLKRQQMIEYGYGGRSPGGFEEDHLISLELGGAPRDPRNLWPELGHSMNPKDNVENELHSRVCSGQITLAAAQYAIATNWTTALGTAH